MARLRVARLRAVAVAVALTVSVGLSAACGSDDDDGGGPPPHDPDHLSGVTFESPGTTLPVTLTDSSGSTVTVDSVDRIMPLNGDLLETVYALGLGDRVVARDLSATYPPESQSLPLVGYQRGLAPEPIAAQSPTLILGNAGAGPSGTIDQLRSLYPTVIYRYEDDVAGPPDKIRAVARTLGVADRGEALARQVEQEIVAARDLAAQTRDEPRVALLYLRGSGVQVLFGRGLGATALIEAAGGTDVSVEMGIADSAPLDIEALLAAQPDVILATASGLESVGGVDGLLDLENGAFARTPAGKNRRILAYEDQYLLGFGPRTGQLLNQLTLDLHPDLKDGS